MLERAGKLGPSLMVRVAPTPVISVDKMRSAAKLYICVLGNVMLLSICLAPLLAFLCLCEESFYCSFNVNPSL